MIRSFLALAICSSLFAVVGPALAGESGAIDYDADMVFLIEPAPDILTLVPIHNDVAIIDRTYETPQRLNLSQATSILASAPYTQRVKKGGGDLFAHFG